MKGLAIVRYPHTGSVRAVKSGLKLGFDGPAQDRRTYMLFSRLDRRRQLG
jgi:hypothetical protein